MDSAAARTPARRASDAPTRSRGPVHSLCTALFGTLLLLTTAGANADEVRARLAECRAIANVLPRLDCYDRLANAEGRARRSDTPTRTAPSVDDSFGRDAPASADPPLESVTSVVESVERRPRGEYVFRLENGQTWTELSPGRRRFEQGVTVEIRRTRLGGYMLTTDGARATRVRRLD